MTYAELLNRGQFKPIKSIWSCFISWNLKPKHVHQQSNYESPQHMAKEAGCPIRIGNIAVREDKWLRRWLSKEHYSSYYNLYMLHLLLIKLYVIASKEEKYSHIHHPIKLCALVHNVHRVWSCGGGLDFKNALSTSVLLPGPCAVLSLQPRAHRGLLFET